LVLYYFSRSLTSILFTILPNCVPINCLVLIYILMLLLKISRCLFCITITPLYFRNGLRRFSRVKTTPVVQLYPICYMRINRVVSSPSHTHTHTHTPGRTRYFHYIMLQYSNISNTACVKSYNILFKKYRYVYTHTNISGSGDNDNLSAAFYIILYVNVGL